MASENLASSSSSSSSNTHAVVSWEGNLEGPRLCLLAHFGSTQPWPRTAHRLVYVRPPRADVEHLSNAAQIAGAIAFVVRGGSSFVDKARRVQRAGAIAMIVANNTREAPVDLFAMATSPSEQATIDDITIPCMVMCLLDVRALFQRYPPTEAVSGVMELEILDATDPDTSLRLAACEEQRQRLLEEWAARNSQKTGWTAFKRKPSAIARPNAFSITSASSSNSNDNETTAIACNPDLCLPTASDANSSSQSPTQQRHPATLFGFVQWARNAREYCIWFAPLSDFCKVADGAIYDAAPVACDPLLAHEALRNADAIAGSIALTERGACLFPTKLEHIQRCGAVAAIVGNDDPDDPDAAFVMSVDRIRVEHLTMPSLMVSRNVFDRLRQDQPLRLRILCLSGPAAAQSLEHHGLSLPFDSIPMPPDDTLDDLHQFHLACRNGDLDACEVLLDAVATDAAARRTFVRRTDAHGLTALHHAAAGDADNDAVVTLLLRANGLVTAKDHAQRTPLHIACHHAHVASVKRLLAASDGAAAAIQAHLGGATPLHEAVLAKSSTCVELLLSSAAQMESDGSYAFRGVDLLDADGATPLHRACERVAPNCVMYLIAANANVSLLDKAGRSPVSIACDQLNNVECAASALRIVEQLMEAGASLRVPNSNILVLDRIQSAPLKRELEIVYLRREAVAAREALAEIGNNDAATLQRLESLQQRLHDMEVHLDSLENRIGEHNTRQEEQNTQMENLQRQMQMLLQVVRLAGPQSGLSGGVGMPIALAVTSTPPGSDEDRAQEAALARDLGRKSCRQGEFSMAEMYFDRSLQLYPLPGVQRLREEAAHARRAAESVDERSYAEAVSTETVLFAKQARILERIQAALARIEAPASTKEALRHEFVKLEQMDTGTSSFETTAKWLEWLVSLPWDDPDNGFPNRLQIPLDAFDHLEQMEISRELHQRHQAACMIQKCFRTRYASHLVRRANASIRIQNAYRQFRQQRIRKALLLGSRHRDSDKTTDIDGNDITKNEDGRLHDATKDKLFELDNLSVTVDTFAFQRLHSCRGELSLVDGISDNSNANRFVVVQLVASTSKDHSSAVAPSPANGKVEYFVWERWGETRESARQCVVGGPYDSEEVARRRYENARRDQRVIRNPSDSAVSFSDMTSPASKHSEHQSITPLASFAA